MESRQPDIKETTHIQQEKISQPYQLIETTMSNALYTFLNAMPTYTYFPAGSLFDFDNQTELTDPRKLSSDIVVRKSRKYKQKYTALQFVAKGGQADMLHAWVNIILNHETSQVKIRWLDKALKRTALDYSNPRESLVKFQQVKKEAVMTQVAASYLKMSAPILSPHYEVSSNKRIGYSFLFMKWLSDENLHQWLAQRKNQNAWGVLYIALELCKQATNLHQRKIIHRDLKSENVLIDDNLTPLLIDFGHAKYKDELDDGLCGTLDTVDPLLIQKVLNENDFKGFPTQLITTKADIFALGRIIEDLLKGFFLIPELNYPKDKNPTEGEDSEDKNITPKTDDDISVEALLNYVKYYEDRCIDFNDSAILSPLTAEEKAALTQLVCELQHDDPNQRPELAEFLPRLAKVIEPLLERLPKPTSQTTTKFHNKDRMARFTGLFSVVKEMTQEDKSSLPSFSSRDDGCSDERRPPSRIQSLS